MTTRRPLLPALTALALALALAACGDDDDTADAGDPTTTEATEAEATTTEAPPEEAAGDEGEAGGEAGDVVATVFDSSVPFEDKAALIEGGEAHRADHDGYVAAADAVGGITVEATDVAPDGDTATITYRVLFGGNEAYSGLTMDVTRVDDAWVVPTDAFCGFLASARTPCAAS
jgi:iron complex transport system substrate-binding protein